VAIPLGLKRTLELFNNAEKDAYKNIVNENLLKEVLSIVLLNNSY